MGEAGHPTLLFEAIMLICFGASWPFAVLKTWRSRTSKGKSFIFMGLILVGYLSGILHRTLYYPSPIVWLYVLNGVMVATDIVLSWRFREPVVPAPPQAPGA